MTYYPWSPFKSLGFTLKHLFSFDGDGEEESEQGVCDVCVFTWVCADMYAGVCASVGGAGVNLGCLLLLSTFFFFFFKDPH